LASAARIASGSGGAARPGADQALEDRSVDKRAAHLGKEPVVEPAHQPAHLDPAVDVGGQQPVATQDAPRVSSRYSA
jgi:hypothetical protein